MQAATLEPDRVRRSTAPEVNARIDDTISETVQRYASAPLPLISQRIGALEEEWDIERVLETNASSLALAGVLLGAVGHRRGLLLATGVLGFLLMHATKGWCPPLPLLRRLGVRTRREIEREKFVLKYLRGDFAELSQERTTQAAAAALAATQA
jgi:hypothetical protein